MKKYLCAVISALLLCVSLCACGEVPYSKPIEATIQLTYYGNKDCLKYVVPEEYYEWYEYTYDIDFEEDYFDGGWDNHWAEKFGEDYEVNYEISNEKEVNKYTFEDIKTELELEFGIDSSDVKKAYIFDIEFFIEGAKESDSSRYEELYSVKIDNNWYLLFYDKEYKYVDFFCYPW